MNISVIKYIGKKDINLIEKIKNINIESYCEPFSGSFNLGLNLIENGFKGETYLNDLSYNIYIFWVELQKDYEQLYYNIEKHLEIIYKIKEQTIYIENLRNSNISLDVATGEYIYRTFRNLTGLKIDKRKVNKDIHDFYLNHIYLNKVNISNKNFKDIIKDTDKDSNLLMVDPPYMLNKKTEYYNINNINHLELFNILSKCSSKWILTYNDCNEIRQMYKNYNIEEISNNSIFKSNELIISNI